jgi:hypothetical protein
MSNTYVDANGNIITTTVSSNTGPVICTTDDIGLAEINEVRVLKILMEALAKDSMFELTYPDGSKAVVDFKGAMEALVDSSKRTTIKVLDSDAAKVLFKK